METVEMEKTLKEYGSALAGLQSDLAAEKAKAGPEVAAIKAELEALKLKIESGLKVTETYVASEWAAFWSGLFGE